MTPARARAIGAGKTRTTLTAAVAAVLAAAAVLAVIVILHVLTVMSEAAVNGYASYWDSVGQQVQQAKEQP
jgi:hypothetical protein